MVPRCCQNITRLTKRWASGCNQHQLFTKLSGEGLADIDTHCLNQRPSGITSFYILMISFLDTYFQDYLFKHIFLKTTKILCIVEWKLLIIWHSDSQKFWFPIHYVKEILYKWINLIQVNHEQKGAINGSGMIFSWFVQGFFFFFGKFVHYLRI